MGTKYSVTVDRDSAHEKLRARAERAKREAADADQTETRSNEADREFANARRYNDGGESGRPAPKASSGRSDSIGETFAKSFARQLGSRSGQAIIRGILGSFFKKR